MTDNLIIYYQNCRGVRTKLHTLYMNILANSYDVIILTETWLTPDITDSEFIDERYTVHRCDRDRTATKRKDGGGVLVAVLKELRSVRLLPCCFVHTHIEHILIQLPCSGRGENLIIAAVYIPPKTPESVYVDYFDLLQSLLGHNNLEHFYLLGDYNLPEIEWVSCTAGTSQAALTCRGNSPTGIHLCQFMCLLGAHQFNNARNLNGRVLDLVISNDDCTTYSPTDYLLQLDHHHPPFCMLISVSLPSRSMVRKTIKKYNYFKANYENINHDLKEINWDDAFSSDGTPDEYLGTFYNTIFGVIRKHVPLVSTRTLRFPVWFSKSLIQIYKNKSKAWVKWKTYKNLSDYEQFILYRARFQSECKESYRGYINSVEDGIRDNIKHFWTFISKQKSTTGIPSAMKYKDQPSNNSEDICNIFSDFFHSVYEPSTLTNVPSSHTDCSPTCSLISDIEFSLDDVLRGLELLDPSKGSGPDGLPVIFIKKTATNLCTPLHTIFNLSISKGIFPQAWKLANITPVYKSGPKHDVENYRPISILSALSKVFERLVHDKVYPLLHSVLLPQQHGFVKRRSTATNLVTFADYLFNNFDARVQTDTIYTDFKKAFDKVDHELLLQKIAFNGIRGDLLRWFYSYVCNRTQRVVINGFCSTTVDVTSGVPQGSILGPLLFILFINDVDKCFPNSELLLYADDIKVFRSIKSHRDCLLLQEDLDAFSAYCARNKLQLSVSKCYVISFTKNKNKILYPYTLKNENLKRETLVRDLGILLDDKLHLDCHINKIVNNAFRMFGFIMRTATVFTRSSTYLYLYRSLVRSQLEYAVSVWNPHYGKYSDMIEKVQRKFLKAMHFRCHRTYSSYNDLLRKYNLQSLKSRRIMLETVFLFDLCNTYDCIDIRNRIGYVVPRTTICRGVRARPLFAVSSCRTNAGLRAPLRRLTNQYNKIFEDIDFFFVSAQKFRKLTNKIILEYDS